MSQFKEHLRSQSRRANPLLAVILAPIVKSILFGMTARRANPLLTAISLRVDQRNLIFDSITEPTRFCLEATEKVMVSESNKSKINLFYYKKDQI